MYCWFCEHLDGQCLSQLDGCSRKVTKSIPGEILLKFSTVLILSNQHRIVINLRHRLYTSRKKFSSKCMAKLNSLRALKEYLGL